MINEHNRYINRMLEVCEQHPVLNWKTIRPHAENEFRGLLLMLEWLKKMKKENDMSTELARIHVDIQKNTMRTRLMSLPDVTLINAESIINLAIDSIRKELYDEMEWVII
jgi:hypothetical protein